MMSKSPTIIRIVRDPKQDRGRIVYSTDDGLEFSPVLDRRKDSIRGVRPLASLLTRWSPGNAQADLDFERALNEGAPAAAVAYRDAKSATNVHDLGNALDRFTIEIQRWRDERSTIHRSVDAAIAHYTAPIFSLNKVIEKRYTEPSLINLIPKIATGTALNTWQYYMAKMNATLPQRSWSHDPTTGGNASEEYEPILFRFLPSREPVGLDARAAELHNEMRGKEGAPDWDIMARRIESASRQVYRDIARMAVFGDPVAGVRGLLEFPDGAVSGDNTGAGALAVGPIGYLAGNVASYDALNEQIRRQQEQVGDDPDLVANRLALSPSDFNFLAHSLLDAGGTNGDGVIESFWRANPGIMAIDQGLELAPRAADAAALEAHGVATAEAERLSGGIRVAGVQRACALLYRDDPDVFAWVEGIPLSTAVYPPQYGKESALVRASCGGTRVFAEGMQAAADPTPGAATGAIRVFWRA